MSDDKTLVVGGRAGGSNDCTDRSNGGMVSFWVVKMTVLEQEESLTLLGDVDYLAVPPAA